MLIFVQLRGSDTLITKISLFELSQSDLAFMQEGQFKKAFCFMQIIDLFSGIGGFSLAGSWMGWETIQFCEIDKYCQAILGQHFPNVPIHDNIKTLKGEQIKTNPDKPTIIVGGFPCQPYSIAGKRKGKEDDRHLFPEMLRIIREVRPKYVVGENVAGIVSWDGGLVFEEVQSDLEAEGYEVQAFILPAVSVGAPHRRDRVWFIAYSISDRCHSSKCINFKYAIQGNKWVTTQDFKQWCGRECGFSQVSSNVTNSNLQRCKELNFTTSTNGKKLFDGTFNPSGLFNGFPTQSPVCGRNDGISNRVDRIKALGNAIVPQVAYQIFKAIQLLEDNY